MISPTVLIQGAVVALAFGAGSYVTHSIWSAKYEKERRELVQAGVEVLRKYDENVKVEIDGYRKKLNAVSNRPPKRVFICPDDGLPPATGGVAGPSTGVVDNHDYGPDLRAARDALIRCNALIEVVK